MVDYRIEFAKRAREDIIDIGDYIAYHLSEPDTSRRFINGLRHSIAQLKFFPYQFPLVQNEVLYCQGIRCMPYKNYYVFYKIIQNQKQILILRVGYNKRNWKDILS